MEEPISPEHEAPLLPSAMKPSQVLQLLRQDVIDKEQLQRIAFDGLDNDPESRPIVWRMLLDMVGPRSSEWMHELQAKRNRYAALQIEFQSLQHRSRSKDDESLLHEIEKDVARTHVDLPFFTLDGNASKWMLHILYLFAKSHPEIGYCQGMHELLAPLVYVFGTDQMAEWSSYAEADSFIAFEALMELLAPLHLASKQQPSKTGVQIQMARLHTLLRQHDAPLWLQLNSMTLVPEYYSFRWYITLLSHEFSMDATLRLWDALLSDSKRFAFLHYVCCALIISHRETLMHRNADFGTCLTALQSKPTIAMEELLRKARHLREVDRQADMNTRKMYMQRATEVPRQLG